MAAHEDEVHMSNERMVNQLRRSGALRSQACVDAFKAVDRAHFWIRGLRSEIYGTEVYGDDPLRYGNLHQSAPHIYARALEALMPLKTGMSFLNIGSGTGYFSSLVAEILGDGVNDGLELWPENVAHAQERCNMLGKHHITFNVGNVYQLNVNLGMRYSRIYIGACACPRAQYLYSLLEVGGILVGPFQSGHSQQLRRVIRESETHFKIEILNSVHFAALIEPPTSTDAGDMEQASGTPVPPPGTPVVGLPGVPFAFALRQKPWTVERNWAYPHSFRCITAALLRSKNSSGLLPMELWIEHVLPWCPRWWFDQPSEITQKSALAMLGKRMSKVFFSTSTCSTASGISDEAEGAASGDEVHFTTVTTAPGATANATAPRAPPRRSMYRIATRAVRRCLRCVARCWTTSRSTPNALQSPSDGETVPLDSRGVGTGEAEDEATQPEQSRPLGGVRWCLGSIVTPCTSLRRLLRRLVPV